MMNPHSLFAHMDTAINMIALIWLLAAVAMFLLRASGPILALSQRLQSRRLERQASAAPK